MEKFPFGKKIRKVAALTGLSALSVLPGEKPHNNYGSPQENKNEKIEWTRQELKAGDLNNISAELITYEELKYREGSISFCNETIRELTDELNFRKLKGKSSEKFSLMSDEKIQEVLSDAKEYIKILKQEVDSLSSKTKEYNQTLINEIKTKEVEVKKIIDLYDKGRQWVLDNINNPKYKERLMKEEKKSFPDSSKSALSRITSENLAYRKGEAQDENYILSSDIKKSYGPGAEDLMLGAFFKPEDDNVYLPLDKGSEGALECAIHEYAHKVTACNLFLSNRAIDLFSQAFDSLSVITHLSGGAAMNKDTLGNVLYFSNPTEMYARKKEFEYDLERLGVKKYEEKFTVQHYIKALELQKAGKLGNGSNEFLYSIKPKFIIKVMNEIADAGDIKNSNGKGTYYHQAWDYGQDQQA